jgi:ADP-ribosyl-[dinitrogen reductase] hydrolase
MGHKIKDKAYGVLLASACADALGAPYEFKAPIAADVVARMADGAQFKQGEWTDDTCQSIAIATAAATEVLESETGLQLVADNFLRWFQEERKGIGMQTAWIFSRAGHFQVSELERLSQIYLEGFPRAAGNGSLMRTGPVALSFLKSKTGLQATARKLSALTHADQTCVEACALWSEAIHYAIFHDSFDGFQLAIDEMSADRRDFWQPLKDEAEQKEPWHFDKTGWVIHSVQAAWSAISRTDQSGPSHLEESIRYAVRCGNDTDTVAAIAGSLLGARWGAAAVPDEWETAIFGWPNARAGNLEALAEAIIARQELQG